MYTEEQIAEGLEQLFGIAGGIVKLQSLHLVTCLNIPELLKEQPKSVTELAEETGSHPEALYRVLRMLANESIFTEKENRLFAQNNVSHLLCKDVPHSLYDYFSIDFLPEWIWKTVKNMDYSVQTGKPAFPYAHDGMNLWNYFTQINTEAGQRFNEKMIGLSSAYSEPTLTDYSFSDMKMVADIGGGHGGLLVPILRKNPHLHGILFDQPQVIKEVQDTIATDVIPRCQLEGGDFFESVPAQVDIYVLRYVLHNWNDAACIQLLKNCRNASPKAKILIVERILHPLKNRSFTLTLDLWMLMLFDNAKERTEAEYSDLLQRAGYHLERIIFTDSPFSIIEGVPT